MKNISFDKIKTGLQKNSEPRLFFGRPKETIPPDSTRYYKFISDPDPNNDLPFLAANIHWIAKKPTVCLGEICRKTPGFPCFRSIRMWKEICEPLYKKKTAGGLSAAEKEEYQEQMKIKNNFSARTNHFFYVVDVTPAISDDQIIVPYRKCFGDRVNRQPTDQECLGCPWQVSCMEGIKIMQLIYNERPGTNPPQGNKLLALFSNDKRVKAIFNPELGSWKSGEAATKVIKATRAGDVGRSNYTYELLDDDMALPEDVLKFWKGQIAPMSKTILPYISLGLDEVRALIDQEAASSEFAFVAADAVVQHVADDDDDTPTSTPKPDASSLAAHPNAKIRGLAAARAVGPVVTPGAVKGKKTKEQLMDEKLAEAGLKRRRCYGKTEVFERGSGPCVVCEEETPEQVDACEETVAAALGDQE